MRAKVALCVPSGHTWTAHTAISIAELSVFSVVNDIGTKIISRQCSQITLSRNMHVREALGFEPQATHILWIDSVTPDTPILVRREDDNWIDFIEACELILPGDRFLRGRTYSKCSYEVLTHEGWQKPKAVMQAKVSKPILRITDELGTVSVTEDHSLFSNGEAIAGRDIRDGTKLDHLGLSDVGIPENDLPPVTEEYAEVLGLFAAEGSAGRMRKADGSPNGWFLAISNKDKALLEKCAKVLSSVHARRFILIEDKKAGYESVWKLCPSYPSEVAPYYVDTFYSPTAKKRVPKFILNAPLETVKAFLRGYEIGDGHVRQENLQCLTTNSKLLAAGLHLLYARLGRNFSVDSQRPDKPDIVSMKERRHGLDRLKSAPGVRHIQRDETYDGWVYDLNTEAGTFVGGIGLFVLHNSDMKAPANALVRLLDHDKDIVGAFYNKRTPPFETVGHLLECKDIAKGGLRRADVMPGGFVLVKREVYEKLSPPWYHESYDKHLASEGDPDGTVGEDVNFTRAAIKAGYDIWCDLDLTFEMGHVGEIVVPCVRPEPGAATSSFKQPTKGGANATS